MIRGGIRFPENPRLRSEGPSPDKGSSLLTPVETRMATDQFYVRIRGKVTGPFRLDQLRSLCNRGQLGRFHEISEDRRAWVGAGSLAGLFPAPHGEPAAKGDGEQSVHPPDQSEAWFFIDSEGNQQGPVLRTELASSWKGGSL